MGNTVGVKELDQYILTNFFHKQTHTQINIYYFGYGEGGYNEKKNKMKVGEDIDLGKVF